MTSVNFPAVLPEVMLALFAMLALIGAVYTGKDKVAGVVTWATITVMVVLAAWIGLGHRGDMIAFDGMFQADAFARFAKITILLSTAAVLAMSVSWMQRNDLLRFEFPVLVALAVVGMMLMVIPVVSPFLICAG